MNTKLKNDEKVNTPKKYTKKKHPDVDLEKIKFKVIYEGSPIFQLDLKDIIIPDFENSIITKIKARLNINYDQLAQEIFDKFKEKNLTFKYSWRIPIELHIPIEFIKASDKECIVMKLKKLFLKECSTRDEREAVSEILIIITTNLVSIEYTA